MTQTNIIAFCGLLLIYNSFALKCGKNEMEVKCGDVCKSDFCPKHENWDTPCPYPKDCPAPACKCIFDHRRAENGTCIPTNKCPPFQCNRAHEVHHPCPPACSDDCQYATRDGTCPPSLFFIGIVLPCTPSCRCEDGYWRKGGECVQYALCSKQ